MNAALDDEIARLGQGQSRLGAGLLSAGVEREPVRLDEGVVGQARVAVAQGDGVILLHPLMLHPVDMHILTKRGVAPSPRGTVSRLSCAWTIASTIV